MPNRKQDLSFWAACVILTCQISVHGRGTYLPAGSQSESSGERPRCMMRVTEQIGCLFSPAYPHNYPKYSSCSYEIRRYSRDVCQIKLIFDAFSVSKSPGCTQDFLEVQDEYSTQRVCGVLPSGTEKYAVFPPDSDVLHLRFRAGYFTSQGFSISVKQLRSSCYETTTMPPVSNNITSLPMGSCDQVVRGRSGRITSPEYPRRYKTGRTCAYTIYRSESRACRIELDFRSFDVEQTSGCSKDFLLLADGSRLCGPLTSMKRSLVFAPDSDHMTFMFTSEAGGIGGNGFDIQVSQLPGPCTSQYDVQSTIKQCDQEITEMEGTLTSPGYPNSFGPNYECTLTINKPDPSVCDMELQFLEFDVGHHNPATCSPGAYLELPGHVRLCQPYTGKKMIHVPEFQDPVILRFVSDSYSSGNGFKINVTQIPNTCKGYEQRPTIPDSTQRCYQEVATELGYFTAPKQDTCEFAIKRISPSTCAVQLQVSLRGNLYFPCAANHIVLPDGKKLCIEISTITKIPFPKNMDSLILVYHGHGDPDFSLLVTQLQDDCPQPSTMEPVQHLNGDRWYWKLVPRHK